MTKRIFKRISVLARLLLRSLRPKSKAKTISTSSNNPTHAKATATESSSSGGSLKDLDRKLFIEAIGTGDSFFQTDQTAKLRDPTPEEAKIFEIIRGLFALFNIKSKNTKAIEFSNSNVDVQAEVIHGRLKFWNLFLSDGSNGRIYHYQLPDDSVHFSEVTRRIDYNFGEKVRLSSRKYEVLFRDASFRGRVIFDSANPGNPDSTYYLIETIEGQDWAYVLQEVLNFEQAKPESKV